MYKIKTNQELKLLYIHFIAFTFDCFTRICRFMQLALI